MAKLSMDTPLNPDTFAILNEDDDSEIFAQCSAGIPQGAGILTKEGSEMYLGMWKDGRFEGIGILKVSNEHSYCGEFTGGKPKGLGMLRKDSKLVFGKFDFEKMSGDGLYSKDNFQYSGSFENCVIKGFGEFEQLSRKMVYRGYFKNGEYSGEGKLTSPTSVYMGYFANNRKSGAGRETEKTSGEEYTGYWYGDKREAFGRQTFSDGKSYTGEWKQDQQQGVARIDYKGRDYRYIGQVVGGLREGIGKMEAPKFTYLGQWHQNKMKGLGIETKKDGSVYFGYWKNNKKNGLGQESGPEFNFKGEWKDGKPHGKGYVTTISEVLAVVFEDGQITETVESGNLPEIDDYLAELNCDTFYASCQSKVSNIDMQVQTSMKQIEDELKPVSSRIAIEEVKLDKYIESITLQVEMMVEKSKVIEHLLRQARLSYDSTHDKDAPEEPISVQPTRLSKEDSKMVSVFDPQPVRESVVYNSQIETKEGQPAVEKQKRGEPDTESQALQKSLEEQAIRLAEYEKWLVNERLKIKSNEKSRKRTGVNKEFSTESMKEEDERRVRTLFKEEFSKVEADLESLTHALKSMTSDRDNLRQTCKTLEQYSNDVDCKNYRVTAAIETLKAETKKKVSEYTVEIKDLKSKNEKQASDIKEMKSNAQNLKKEIESLCEERKRTEEILRVERHNFEDLKFKYVRAVVEISALRIALDCFIREKSELLDKVKDLKEKISKSASLLSAEKESRAEDHKNHESTVAKIRLDHSEELKSIHNDRAREREEHDKLVAHMKRQIRVLETGGEVDDTDEKLRLKEVEDLKQKNNDLTKKVEELSYKQECMELEVENVHKKLSNKEKMVKELTTENESNKSKVEKLEESLRVLQLKQKEWSEMKDALANNIKLLKDREQDLQSELQSKKILEQEEIQKRNDKLTKGFFNEGVKPKILMGLGS